MIKFLKSPAVDLGDYVSNCDVNSSYGRYTWGLSETCVFPGPSLETLILDACGRALGLVCLSLVQGGSRDYNII